MILLETEGVILRVMADYETDGQIFSTSPFLILMIRFVLPAIS